ncbi:MAG: two component transcriptional regulator, LuxR family [Myxococcales bacterium]|nr:two component transcriptional regulator, LuxR family [Myxococcales bacterium]
MKRRRIILVEDHVLIRAGLRVLLERVPNLEVVGEADNGSDALKLVAQLHPDVMLMDISMPIMNGIETTRRVLKQHPKTRVLILSVHSDGDFVRQALLAGASGYVVKTADERELELAITTVLRGEVWISPAVAKTIVDDVLRGETAAAHEELTPRQREVLQLVAEGHSTKQIARRLHVSVKTVETHRAQIMQRLNVRNVAGLVRYAIRARIISTD